MGCCSDPCCERGELVCTLAPALVEAHLFMDLAVFGGPVAYTGGVASLAAFVVKGEDYRHERLGRGLPGARIGISKYQALVRHHLEIDAAAGNIVAVRAALVPASTVTLVLLPLAS